MPRLTTVIAAAGVVTAMSCSAAVPVTESPRPEGTRSLSGEVRSGGQAIANAQVQVLGTPHQTAADSQGRWHLHAVPTSQVVLQGSFIGYVKSQLEVAASTSDQANLLIELDAYGGPDSSMTEPLPPADIRGVLEALLTYFGPSNYAAAAELAAASTLTDGSPPPRAEPGPSVVLDTLGDSYWKQIPHQWMEDWLQEGRIVAVCGTRDSPGCRDLDLASYLVLKAPPRRTSPDTAYVSVTAYFFSARECNIRHSMGDSYRESVRVVRLEDSWLASSFPGGRWLFATLTCGPQ